MVLALLLPCNCVSYYPPPAVSASYQRQELDDYYRAGVADVQRELALSKVEPPLNAPVAELVQDEVPAGQSYSETAWLTASQKRAIKSIILALGAHGTARYTDKRQGVFWKSLGVKARQKRFDYIVEVLDEAWPELTPFERRSLARVIGPVMDWRLTVGNFVDATLRGEVVRLLEEEDPALGRKANVVNFLILLNRAMK